MKKTTLTLAAAALFSTLTVAAGTRSLAPAQFDLTKHLYQFEAETAFSGPRVDKIQAANRQLLAHAQKSAASADTPAPELSYNGFSDLGDIDGPNGEVWYYTLQLENEEIKYDYFTDYILKSYTIDIYDANHQHVGTIKDEMDYQDGEKRVVQCEVLPSITSKFFNDDDNYEVVVCLAVNWQPGINHYRSVVYQINGQKDEQGDDVVVATMPGMVGDVLDASVEGGEENVYMTLMVEDYSGEYPYDQEGTEAVWDYIMAQNLQFDIYGKFGANGELNCVLSHKIPLQCLPGDQENTPMLITMSDNGIPYAVFSRYKESFYNPYYTYDEDLSMRENNSLVINIFRLGATDAQLAQTTEVNVTKDEGAEILATYYSIGDLRYRGDINFSGYGNDGQATFIVCAGNKYVGNDESLVNSYYIVEPDGTVRTTLFRNAYSAVSLGDLPGFEPQAFFITYDSAGNAIFTFVDLVSGKQVAQFSNLIEVEDSDPDPMTTNIQRVVSGNSYKYVAEMQYPVDMDDNTYMRFAWLNADGSLDHFESVNMGKYVYYAMSYLTVNALSPKYFHTDDNMEYMVLIKRGQDNETKVEELLIATALCEDYPEGRDLLLVSTDPERGPLASIYSYETANYPVLVVAFSGQDGKTYSSDLYRLPFDWATGVRDITADIDLTDAPAEVFNLQGIRIATIENLAGLNDLATGLYIVRQGDVTKKIIKK